MLRTMADQPTLWESMLPPEVLRLPAELARVNALLDDPAFFAPFMAHFDPRFGRPSIPMETYLRLMFLKYRYRLGYESLCREVADSISWRRFARIGLDGAVPHPTTLMKITTRCGDSAVAALNEALWAKASEAKLLRTHKVRADTTVVPANVVYPTDSGLLAKAVGKLARIVARVHAAGGAVRTKAQDRRRAAGRRMRQLTGNLRTRAKLSREENTAAVHRIAGELAGLAEKAATEASAVLRNGCRAADKVTDGRMRGRLERALDELAVTIVRTGRLVGQTRLLLAGQTPAGADRLVSLHDPDARPIRKGRIDRPVEFGYKAQVVDNADGIVLDYNVEIGNPADAPQLAPAVDRITRRVGRPPRAVTADRGYGEPVVDRDLQALGVHTIAIPRKAKIAPPRRRVEHSPGFRRLVKWRTGSEGRISHLKHAYGWDRSRLDGRTGAAIWCGYGVFAHNLTKIGALAG
ncbi:ISNCY family transposase [Nocardia transvalensis]|uniref:ISNCY family transposase n=1 Tax=Nocardia transvalensis TaxID=37333 RepID=UPI001895ACA5|nr:ISNCY family transposase [Nocardia transvalensis]MBF6332418.1 ISNCY family transposase [Nocardia transvalensis]